MKMAFVNLMSQMFIHLPLPKQQNFTVPVVVLAHGVVDKLARYG
jgi:hypothetical protein